MITYSRPSQSRTDLYRQLLMQMLAEQNAEDSQGSGQSGSAGSSIGGLAGTASLGEEIGLWDDLGVKELFSSGAGTNTIGGSAAASGLGNAGMSVQPGMDVATMQSLSNGGAGLSTPVSQYQTVQSTAPVTGSAWTTAPELGSVGGLLSAAAIAKGGYDSAKAWDKGGKGLQQGLGTAGAGLGTLLGGPVGGLAGAAYGNVLGYGLKNKGWKAYGALAATAPMLIPAKALGLKPHKSTKQYEAERWGKLAKENVPFIDAAYRANHPEGDTGVWSTGKYAGQKWSFDKANDLAKTGGDFNEVLGNYEIDSKWGTYSPEQKKAITNLAAQQNLYYGDKGDVRIKDKDAFFKLRDSILTSQSKDKGKK